MGGNLAIQNILVSDTAFADIGSNSEHHIATKVFYDEAAQTQPTPFGIVRLDSIEPNDPKEHASNLDFDNVTLLLFGGTDLEAHQLAVAARNACDRKTPGTYNGIVTDTIQFLTMRSDSEFIENKKIFVYEQQYKVITKT